MNLRSLGLICALATMPVMNLPGAPVTSNPSSDRPAANSAKSKRCVPKKKEPKADPASDSAAYLNAAAAAEKLRLKRRLSEEDFLKMAKEPGTIVLDARSATAFQHLRIKGSVNLPYTDMGVESLARVIPTKETRVLIYCRNNLVGMNPLKASDKGFPVTPSTPTIKVDADGHRYPTEFEPPEIPKIPAAALTIPTYVTLYLYGYRNVWELEPTVDPNRTVIEFESEKKN